MVNSAPYQEVPDKIYDKLSCAAWRRGYNVLQHLPFGSGLSDKHLKVSDLHFLMALAESNRTRHPCINVAFDALNTIPVKHQSG